MKNLVVLFALTLIIIFGIGCSKPATDVEAAAAKAKFDAAYNHDKIMKLGGAEAEAERLRKFQ